MPVRIYDISKKLGLENRDVLLKAKALGINAAKVPSSQLDKISAEYLEEELIKDHPELAARLSKTVEVSRVPVVEERIQSTATPPPQLSKPAPRVDDNFPNSNTTLRFEIKISGSWSPAFMRQLQSGGINIDIVLDSGQDQTDKIRFGLVPNVAQNLDSRVKKVERVCLDEKTRKLLMAAYGAASENKDGEWVTLASFGDVIKKLNPDFKLFQVGASSLSELMSNSPDLFETKTDTTFQIPRIFIRPKPAVENQNAKPKLSGISTQIAPRPEFENQTSKRVNGHIMSLHAGYGFLKPELGENGLFFHASELIDIKIEALKVGDSVSYIPGSNERGPCARFVKGCLPGEN